MTPAAADEKNKMFVTAVTENRDHPSLQWGHRVPVTGGMDMQEGKKVKKKAQIPRELCVACGCCIRVCPKEAIQVYRGMYAVVDTALCVGCGKCARECPAGIIRAVEVMAE